MPVPGNVSSAKRVFLPMAHPPNGILAMCLLGLSLSAVAQHPFPTPADQPVWNVLDCGTIDGLWCSTVPSMYIDSVSACGHAYGRTIVAYEDTLYVRNDGPRTVFRVGANCLDREYLMYDYSLSVGDTVYPSGPFMAGLGADSAWFILESIDTVVQQGVPRRRFGMNYDLSNGTGTWGMGQMDWIEGIGSTTHPFYAGMCIVDFVCAKWYQLLCYDSASVNLYLDTVLNTCDTVIMPTRIEEGGRGRGEMAVSWDPLTRELIVHLNPSLTSGQIRFMLVGMDGSVSPLQTPIRSGAGDYRFPARNLAAGIYVVQVAGGGSMVARGRVVVQ